MGLYCQYQPQGLYGNVMVNFSKDFGKHHIDALALMEGQKYTYDWNSQEAHGFDTNYFKFNNMKLLPM